MDKVCPVCNSLWEYYELCPACTAKMDTSRVLQDYLGAYSPYMEKDLHINNINGKCIHLYFCPVCGCDKRVEIDLVTI